MKIYCNLKQYHFKLQVYIAAMVGLEGGVGNIVSRSLLARLVPQDELGKMYGLLAILDALLPFAGTFAYITICCH